MIIQPEGNLLRTTRISGRQVQEVLRGRKRRRFVRGGSSSSSSESISSSESLSESLSVSDSGSGSSSSSSSSSSTDLFAVPGCCAALPKRMMLTITGLKIEEPVTPGDPFSAYKVTDFSGTYAMTWSGVTYPNWASGNVQWLTDELIPREYNTPQFGAQKTLMGPLPVAQGGSIDDGADPDFGHPLAIVLVQVYDAGTQTYSCEWRLTSYETWNSSGTTRQAILFRTFTATDCLGTVSSRAGDNFFPSLANFTISFPWIWDTDDSPSATWSPA